MAAYVIGHQNPDTDSVISAIAVADLMNKRGIECVAGAQGAATPETQFVLDRFGLKMPKLVSSVAGSQVILVDFSDYAQAPADLKDSEIIGLVDHHKLGDITTSKPLLIWVWPVGCTGTVIKNMYDFYGIEIPRHIAGGLLCAILSDTVLFRSPTNTPEDKKAADELAEIAGIKDLMALGMELFTVKSAVAGVPARDLLFRDYKDFSMNGKKCGIGQLEVMDLSALDSVKPALLAEVKKAKEEGGRHSVFLLLTDIIKEGSELLFCSDDPSIVEKAFNVKPVANSAWLPGVMSRKKDVVPPLEASFGK